MGNAISPGCLPISGSLVKVILFDGTTRMLYGKHLAAEIMFEFPDCMVCNADSFYIGQPIPTLEYDAQLIGGETYLVLPLDCFPSRNLSVSSLAAVASSNRPKGAPALNIKELPFEYVKGGSEGRTLIKVTPEFLIKLVTRGKDRDQTGESSSARSDDDDDHGVLCSTPELRKHYEDLVGSKEQVWSPKLETISECKARYSPWRCMGLSEREQRERES